MIIIMRAGATQMQIGNVVKRIEKDGLTAHLSDGSERTVIGVIGDDRPIDTRAYEIMDGVEKSVQVLQPFKLVSRDLQDYDTIVTVKGVGFGDMGVKIIAGPCSVEDRGQLLESAHAVEEAGAFSILIEAIPDEVSAELYKHITIPLYGIGAGKYVDGQLVISHDMLGLFVGEVDPKFVKKYLDLSESITNAFSQYKKDVENLSFPSEEHLYPIKEDDLKEIKRYSSNYQPKKND